MLHVFVFLFFFAVVVFNCGKIQHNMKITILGDAWVAHLFQHPTLGFGSGHDLVVCGIEPRVRLCVDSVEHARDSLSPSLSAPPSLTHSLSVCLSLKNKH